MYRKIYIHTRHSSHTSATNIKICILDQGFANEDGSKFYYSLDMSFLVDFLIYTTIIFFLRKTRIARVSEICGLSMSDIIFLTVVWVSLSEWGCQWAREFANFVANFHSFTCNDADVILLTAMTWGRFGETWTRWIEWLIGWTRWGWSICH
jgi:hypothetical protein